MLSGRIALCALLSILASPPQAADTFEVAAIHANPSGSPNTQISTLKGGRLIIVNGSVKTLLRNAYGLLPFQFAGGPSWLDDAKFDINAQAGGPEEITPEHLKPLLQSLLADRFHLKIHWETREQPIYALVVDKTGPKLQTHTDAPGHGVNTRKSAIEVRMKGIGVPMSELAGNLGNQLGRFVTDQTGLPGNYDFILEWNLDPSAESSKPSLFTALPEQLGLRLESRKGPVQVLVIDSVEKPSEN